MNNIHFIFIYSFQSASEPYLLADDWLGEPGKPGRYRCARTLLDESGLENDH